MSRKVYDRKLYTDRIKPLLDATPGTDAEKEAQMGIPNKIISNWNNAGYMSWTKYFPELSAFLGVSVEYLKGETDEKNPAPTNEDGLTEAQREFIRLVPTLTDRELDVLLSTAKALIAARQ